MKNGCCIVETRRLDNLVSIIKDHHLKYLPDDWGLTIVCGLNNHDQVKGVNFERDTTVRVLDNPPLTKIAHYNALLKSSMFWRSLPYEKVLIFQADSKLLRTGIEEFMEYDYIGAPRPTQGANGGLSLRSVEVMKYICEKGDPPMLGNEDLAFAAAMRRHGVGKQAGRDVCTKFSVESIFALGSLGVHNIEKWLSPHQCDAILTQYS